MNIIALRLDDVGASTKKHEVYSKYVWKLKIKGQTLKIKGRKLKVHIGNWLFLKYLPAFKAWGPYREMTGQEWYAVYDLLEHFQAKLTVAITAAWAKSEEELIPFPYRFPEEAAALKEGLQQGLLEIANHGLTHCVLKNNAFKPRWFSGNRQYHREFWDWIPPEVHEKHIRQSQDILQAYFQTDIVTFVLPGNVFTDDTLDYAWKYGLRYVSCKTLPRMYKQITIISDERLIPFHDREIVLNGVEWLRQLLMGLKEKEFCFVKELSIRRYLQQSDGTRVRYRDEESQIFLSPGATS